MYCQFDSLGDASKSSFAECETDQMTWLTSPTWLDPSEITITSSTVATAFTKAIFGIVEIWNDAFQPNTSCGFGFVVWVLPYFDQDKTKKIDQLRK